MDPIDIAKKNTKTADETSCVALPCESYDQYFFVGIRTDRETRFEDGRDALKIEKIKNRNIAAVREFAMTLQKKSMNRIFLKTLMGIIA
jgi:hypothetical protein